VPCAAQFIPETTGVKSFKLKEKKAFVLSVFVSFVEWGGERNLTASFVY